MSFELRGADDFYKLSKALKAAGRTELRNELNRRMKEAGRPLIPEIRAAARRELPRRGGLAERMAKRPIQVVTRTGKDPGVRLVMPKTQEGYNDGVIRHPVVRKGNRKLRKGEFGPRNKPVPWVAQRVGPGRWFDDTIVANRSKVLPLLEKAIQSVIDDIARKAR